MDLNFSFLGVVCSAGHMLFQSLQANFQDEVRGDRGGDGVCGNCSGGGGDGTHSLAFHSLTSSLTLSQALRVHGSSVDECMLWANAVGFLVVLVIVVVSGEVRGAPSLTS